MPLSPPPLTPVARSGAREARLRWRVGDVLASCAYLSLDGGPFDRLEGQVDGDLEAVVLRFASGREIVVTWAMVGRRQGLAVLGGVPAYVGAPVAVPMSAAQPWARAVGTALTDALLVWHRPDLVEDEYLLAVRLCFAGGARIVLALGEVHAGELAYNPTGVAVIYDEDVARAYLADAPDDAPP